jgi:hypothetical protein
MRSVIADGTPPDAAAAGVFFMRMMAGPALTPGNSVPMVRRLYAPLGHTSHRLVPIVAAPF